MLSAEELFGEKYSLLTAFYFQKGLSFCFAAQFLRGRAESGHRTGECSEVPKSYLFLKSVLGKPWDTKANYTFRKKKRHSPFAEGEKALSETPANCPHCGKM